MTSYEDTAFFNEVDSFDFCGGHATPKGVYHYHSTPGCLQEQAGAVSGEHSPLIGWAYVSFISFHLFFVWIVWSVMCHACMIVINLAKSVQGPCATNLGGTRTASICTGGVRVASVQRKTK